MDLWFYSWDVFPSRRRSKYCLPSSALLIKSLQALKFVWGRYLPAFDSEKYPGGGVTGHNRARQQVADPTILEISFSLINDVRTLTLSLSAPNRSCGKSHLLPTGLSKLRACPRLSPCSKVAPAPFSGACTWLVRVRCHQPELSRILYMEMLP